MQIKKQKTQKYFSFNPLNAKFTKWSNTRQIADEFFGCVWPFCEIGV